VKKEIPVLSRFDEIDRNGLEPRKQEGREEEKRKRKKEGRNDRDESMKGMME
jgi:hypothetical protein